MIAAWVIIAAGSLLATYLGCVSLLPVDETRYAGVALEMWQHGEFWVPRANGAPYPHKPPLLFWVMQIGWALWGVSLWWIRSAIAGFSVAGLGATYLLARQLGLLRPAAQYAPVILLGTLLWALLTPAVMFDIVVSFFALLSLLGLVCVATTGRWHGLVLVALGLALGLLSKGPVILAYVLPAALLAPLWHPQPGAWRRWYLGIALAAGSGVMLALVWALPAAYIGGRPYANQIFWGQSAGRIVNSFGHARPGWWYLAILPGLLFPWSGWIGGWRRLSGLAYREEFCLRFLLTAILSSFVILSLVSGKQPHYLAPLLPLYAILLARAIVQPDFPARSAWWDAAPCSILWLLAAAAALWAPSQQSARGWPGWVADIPIWIPIEFAVLAALHLVPARRPERRVMHLSSLMIMGLLLFLLGPFRTAAPAYDLSAAAHLVRQIQEQGRLVAHIGPSHNRFRFLGDLLEPMIEIPITSLRSWVCGHSDGVVVMYYETVEAAPKDVHAIHEQPFRGDWMRIVEARELTTWAGCPRRADSIS